MATVPMPSCGYCGAALQTDWSFCVECGNPTAAGDARTAPARWNRLAILALVLTAVGGPFALVFGHVALRQIRRTGERGRVIATVAAVIGYCWLAAAIALTVWYVVASRG